MQNLVVLDNNFGNVFVRIQHDGQEQALRHPQSLQESVELEEEIVNLLIHCLFEFEVVVDFIVSPQPCAHYLGEYLYHVGLRELKKEYKYRCVVIQEVEYTLQ